MLRLRPGYLQAHRNLGDLPGREPPPVEARCRLAAQLMQTGRETEAANILRELLRVGALVSEATNNLGAIEAQALRLDPASERAKAALSGAVGQP